MSEKKRQPGIRKGKVDGICEICMKNLEAHNLATLVGIDGVFSICLRCLVNAVRFMGGCTNDVAYLSQGLQYYTTATEKLRFLHAELRKLKTLKNRSICPTCQGPVNRASVDITTKFVEEMIADLQDAFKEEQEAKREAARVLAERRREEAARLKAAAQKYLLDHVKDFHKALRDWKKLEFEYKLPDIPEADRPIWNKAMELYLDSTLARSRYLDEPELYYQEAK